MEAVAVAAAGEVDAADAAVRPVPMGDIVERRQLMRKVAVSPTC
jgi:hypothetical protein